MTLVSGTYTRPAGQPDTGRVTFTLVPPAIDDTGDQRTPGSETVLLDATGSFSVDLVPDSDLVNLTEGSAVYAVREQVGAMDRAWFVILTDDVPVDLPSRYPGSEGWDGAILPVGGAVPLNMLTDVDVPTPGDGQRLAFQSSSGTWVSAPSLSALGFVTMSYRFDSSPPPSAQHMARNSVDPLLATELYFHQIDRNNQDLGLFFENMRTGDWINLYDPADTDIFEAYDLTGTPTLAASVWTVPVVTYDQAGPVPSNDEILKVLWRLGGTRPA